jgi:hypothetical protein
MATRPAFVLPLTQVAAASGLLAFAAFLIVNGPMLMRRIGLA